MMTPRKALAVGAVAAALAACRDEARVTPSPTGYLWPDSFAFKMEYVAETRSDSAVVLRYEERKELVFAVRDDRYLAWHDSVVKESLVPNRQAAAERYTTEDTLQYYVTVDRRGQVTHSEPGCDPALPACRAALPSALPLEMARLIPRLPVWSPPRGSLWEDTLSFDDTPRPGGVRGSVVTQYRVAGDTVVAGVSLWRVDWRSVRRSFGPVPGVIGVAAPPELKALGVKGTGFRGRAYLAGSIVERLLAPPE